MDKIFFKLCLIAWLLLARNTHMEHRYQICLQSYSCMSLENMMLQPSISIKLVLPICKWRIFAENIIIAAAVQIESQNSWCWEGLLKVIWSSVPAQAGPSKASYMERCPESFWISLRTDTPQLLWVTCSNTRLPSEWKSVSWCSEWSSCVWFCAHCPLACHQAPPNRSWIGCLSV